jgi:GT2 family glycosyltransferase
VDPQLPLISILLLSIDRYDHLKRTLVYNLENISHPYELLICDNGSSDQRVIEFIESMKPAYFRKNSINEGCGHSFNQLYLRAKGTHIALMSNDLLWPKDWGLETVTWANKVSNSGLVGILFREGGNPPLAVKNDFRAHWVTDTGSQDMTRIFGPTTFKREIVEKVGLFAEEFGPYGLEDSDFNERVTMAGLHSFYVPGLKSQHLIEDSGQQTEYRKAKDKSLYANDAIYNKRLKYRIETGDFFEPLPPMREPL